jgi:hypothetical protein
MNQLVSCCAVVLVCWGGLAAHAQDPQAELERVKDQRSRLENQYEEQNRQCYQKLNVNDCKREVQISRSDALRPIIERQRELEAVLRRQKADEQRDKAQERRQAHEKRLHERGGQPVTLPLEAPVVPRQP